MSEAPLALDPAGGNWTVTGALLLPHFSHMAAPLPDGRVLLAGGQNHTGPVASAELYDPATGSWSVTGSMALRHSSGTLTPLPNGKVLVVGGLDSSYLANAELYDPATGTWSATGSLAKARAHHTATLLANGKVLVTGGWAGSENHHISAELYDPATGTWSATGPMLRARSGHTATLLGNGKVLVAGGSGGYSFAHAELYDPDTGTWSATGSLSTSSVDHRAVLLQGGKVLVVGGRVGSGSSARAELYDPTSRTWTLTGSLAWSRSDYFTLTVLANGKVLVAGGPTDYFGGFIQPELYDPVTGTWSVTGAMNQPRWDHTATLLADGSVLVAGGASIGGGSLYADDAELYLKVPDTRLGTTPPTSTQQRGASFAFTSDDVDARFECSLDAEDFNPCTSPATYANLAVGAHTFRVRAVDPFGHADATPASHSWTVDLTPPDTLFTSTPANPSGATATFSFFSEEGASFECSLDGSDFSPCTSPEILFNLGSGSHSFQVRARDGAGNVDESPASHSWRVDLTPLDTTLTGFPATSTQQQSATFAFESNKAGARFECRMDYESFEVCTSPVAYSYVGQGFHIFQVRARDALNSVDETPATHSWMVDLSAPMTFIGFVPANPTRQTVATFGFSSDEGGGRFECSLDDAAFSSCVPPVRYSGLGEGPHLVQVRAIDDAGNVDESPASYSWTVDLTPPDTLITLAPESSGSQTGAMFFFDSTEPGSSFECRVDGAAFTPCASPETLFNLREGSHSFQVRARDMAGNADTRVASHSWTVDLTAPTTLLTSVPGSLGNQPTASFSLGSNDERARFECSLDGSDFSPCEPVATYADLREGTHTFEARARDEAGNVDASPARYVWTVDLTAPATTLTSAPGSKSNQSTATFTFTSSAGASFECSLDAAEFTDCTSPVTYANLVSGAHAFQVRARDGAGNADATPASHSWTVDLPRDPAPEPGEGGGCSAGPGDASWLLASLALLAGTSRRRQRAGN
ncbi:kelch motif-containing protein [Corallococcus sp. AB011P]|uniref:kelch motif-containing protein n=2 Tax=unclassified Corallococcus TaxID=2685029 RepID=UPI0013157E30|nr:kelch motif-containing protein [Corallococcus sp. AB011P]